MNLCIRWLCGLAILSLAVACATVPITGRSQLMLLPTDKVMGASADTYARFMAAAEQNSAVLTGSESAQAAATLRTVKRVSEHVIAAAGLQNQRWDVVVIKAPPANAFVLPHGAIVVFTGLLPLTQNEARLAAVIGHEVAHVVARHQAERLSQVLAGQVALTLVDVALLNSKFRPLIGASLGLGINYGLLLPFSREHESEADHIGLFYMAKAGYDPSEAIEFWERMEASGHRGPFELLSTHPSPETRRAQIQQWLPEAMLYFADRSRPLPSNLAEVQKTLGERSAASALAPLGLRPFFEPGFWSRAKISNRASPTTIRLADMRPCSSGECFAYTSDAGEKLHLTRDHHLVEAVAPDGSWLRFDPPLASFHWPLRVGDTWSSISTLETSAGGKREVRVKGDVVAGDVVAYESVTVPAGSFMAFRVILSLNGTRFQESWWAPETRTGVRSIVPDGRGGHIVSELVDYQKSADPAGVL